MSTHKPSFTGKRDPTKKSIQGLGNTRFENDICTFVLVGPANTFQGCLWHNIQSCLQIGSVPGSCEVIPHNSHVRLCHAASNLAFNEMPSGAGD